MIDYLKNDENGITTSYNGWILFKKDSPASRQEGPDGGILYHYGKIEIETEILKRLVLAYNLTLDNDIEVLENLLKIKNG